MNKKLFNDLWEVFLDIEREENTYNTNSKNNIKKLEIK